MEEVLDDEEGSALAEFQRVLRGREETWDPCTMSRIDSIFGLFNVQRGQRILHAEYEEGPLRVRVDGSRLEINLGQHAPEMRGNDLELLVAPDRYPPSPLAPEFCRLATSRVFTLDLSNIPIDAFSDVHITTEYNSKQIPFPHGNILLLTRIGQVSTRADTAIRINVERCLVSRGFVSSLERTRYITTLRLWKCLTLARVEFPRMGYLRNLHLRLASPFDHPIAKINFSQFPLLSALNFAMDMRVVALSPEHRTPEPAGGMLRYASQGLERYEIGFERLGPDHKLESVRVHLAFEDLLATALGGLLAFSMFERLFLEVAPPAQTHVHVDDDGDVFMTSANPTTCAESILAPPREPSESFLDRCPRAFLRVQSLIRDGIPFDRTVPAFVELMCISSTANVRLVTLGRTASVLTGALPAHPDLFQSGPPRALAGMMAGAKGLAALCLSAGPLSDPRAVSVTPPDTFERFFASTQHDKWPGVLMAGPADANRSYVARVDVRRADMLDDLCEWDAEFVPHGFFVFLARKDCHVNRPSACEAKFDSALADLPVYRIYRNSSGGRWFDFWPINIFY